MYGTKIFKTSVNKQNKRNIGYIYIYIIPNN